jgi:Subtilase family
MEKLSMTTDPQTNQSQLDRGTNQLLPADRPLNQPLYPHCTAASDAALAPARVTPLSAESLLQNVQQLSTSLQQSPQFTGLQQDLDRATNIMDEYRRQALETRDQLLGTVQTETRQRLEQTKQTLLQQAEKLAIQHPEFTDSLDDLKHQLSDLTGQVTTTLTSQIKSTTKEGLSALYRSLKTAYNFSDRLTQELPNEWQHFSEVIAERTLQARETVGAVRSPSHPKTSPIIGVIDSGFDRNQHGDNIVKTIAESNPTATIVTKTGVGQGHWAASLTEFVDQVKATGQTGVANLSFDLTEQTTSGATTTRTKLTATEYAALDYADRHGILVIAAAGNQGTANSSWGQASDIFKNLVLVGASDQNHQLADYSSYGQGLDLLAIGQTQQGTGTSFAAAEVTAIAAQLWSQTPELTATQVEDWLKASPIDSTIGVKQAIALTDSVLNSIPFDVNCRDSRRTTMHDGIDLQSVIWQSLDGAIALERESGTGQPAPKKVVNPIGDFFDDQRKKVVSTVTNAVNGGVKFVRENSENIHTTLDVAGFAPLGIGPLADATNGLFYLAEGNYKEAGASAVAMVPVLGDAAKVALKSKDAIKFGSKVIKVENVTKTIGWASDVVEQKEKADSILDTRENIEKTAKGATETVANLKKGDYKAAFGSAVQTGLSAADVKEGAKSLKGLKPASPVAKPATPLTTTHPPASPSTPKLEPAKVPAASQPIGAAPHDQPRSPAASPTPKADMPPTPKAAPASPKLVIPATLPPALQAPGSNLKLTPPKAENLTISPNPTPVKPKK